VPFSGFLATTARFNIYTVIIVATLANLAGSVVLYWIGRSGGRWILERYGKYVFIDAKHLDKADIWFGKYGAKTVFWSRMLPVVRTFISLPAGIGEMGFGKFTVYTLLGSLPWNAGLAIAGYKAGEHWDFLRDYFHKADYFIVAVIIVAIMWYIAKHLRRQAS